MRDFYKQDSNWLFPEVRTSPSNLEEVEEAISFTVSELEKEPSAKPVVSFSCGKDSLLTLLVTTKALEKLGRPRSDLYILTAITGYEDNRFSDWFSYLQESLFPSFNWLATTKNPLCCYANEVLGLGFPPTSMPNLKMCNGRWKAYPLSLSFNILKEKGFKRLHINGTRAEESKRRADRIKKDGRKAWVHDNYYLTPLAWVKTSTLWDYLERELGSIGVEFSKLQEYYKGKGRDGCWLCGYAKEEPSDVFQAWVRYFQAKTWAEHVKNPIWLDRKKDDRPLNITARASLETRKRLYKEVTENAERLGLRDKYFTPLTEDFIAESWRFTETYLEEGAEHAGVRFWRLKESEYKPLKPYLKDLAFYQKPLKDGTPVTHLRKGRLVFDNRVKEG